MILAYDLRPMYLIFMMQIMFLILGAFMDWVGIVLLAMPVFLPIVLTLGFDPIWFGILFCVNMQVSFLSPPFGPAAFYLKSVTPPHISLTDIFRGFGPFIVIQLIVLACVMFFPKFPRVQTKIDEKDWVYRDRPNGSTNGKKLIKSRL